MDKTKQIWYLYANDINRLKTECYDIIQKLYLQLGQNPEPEIVIMMTKSFIDDLSTQYSSMELEEVKFALNKGLRETDPPVFINVPTYNKFIRDYKKTKALKRQTNQIDQYDNYKKRVESFSKVINNREIKKIGK
tara:strand:+ start:578 stop:982 length:405 start_codon:yes stop_codon:yes gene_type:complete